MVPHALAILENWAEFRYFIETYFREKNFLRLFTPSLVSCPGTEPSLQPFAVNLQQGSHSITRYLPTSPEISIKKILCSGVSNAFEVSSAFRNNEWTDHHLPQFTMLEWYRTNSHLRSIHDDVVDFIRRACEFAGKPAPLFMTRSVADLFREHLGRALMPEHTIEDLKNLIVDSRLRPIQSDLIDDHFFYLWLEVIEPRLPMDQVVFVTDYPVYQSAYAQLDARGEWAQRFEVFWRGLELGNAFQEVTDPEEQRRRFERDNGKKLAAHLPSLLIDEEFLQMMTQMPPTAGIAMGIERIFMALHPGVKITDIHPLLRGPS